MTTSLAAISDRIEAGQFDEARTAIAATPQTDDNRDDLMFLQGLVAERSYDAVAAMDAYDSVLAQNPDHDQAMFHAALLRDRSGDEKAALDLYQRFLQKERVSIRVLMNLAVLLEECGQLDEAETCLNAVLDADPNHWRAHHFLKSVQSSFNMAYDEKSQRERERHSAALDVPITDFELSVRSRNCLKHMGVRSIGDLLKISEAELLSYKNFGETSLMEIKGLLDQCGLHLGEGGELTRDDPPPGLPGDAAVVHKPVSALELSVRARKCVQWLGSATLGELSQRSEAELLAIKNFGQTSLDEIKQQLEKFGLTLRP